MRVRMRRKRISPACYASHGDNPHYLFSYTLHRAIGHVTNTVIFQYNPAAGRNRTTFYQRIEKKYRKYSRVPLRSDNNGG